MKRIVTRMLLGGFFLLSMNQLLAQTKISTVTSGELLFQWANIEFTDEYLANSPVGTEVIGSPLRFTCWFHIGQYVHFDFNNNVGLISGAAIRNVGFISDERIDKNKDGVVEDYKIIRRSYNLGVPLALKIGLFDNNFYVFGGAEYELAFAYKEKYWNSHNRDGEKTKKTQWFGGQTPTFLPSVYAGVQMPHGVHVKFKYYLNDFINHDYTNPNDPISDLTRYKETQVMYLSVSWQFETKKIQKQYRANSSDVKISAL